MNSTLKSRQFLAICALITVSLLVFAALVNADRAALCVITPKNWTTC